MPVSPRALLRAVRYLGHYRVDAILAYTTLLIATVAQLLVPQMVQNMMDAVANGLMAAHVFSLPQAAQSLASQALGLSLDQLTRYQTGAEFSAVLGRRLDRRVRHRAGIVHFFTNLHGATRLPGCSL